MQLRPRAALLALAFSCAAVLAAAACSPDVGTVFQGGAPSGGGAGGGATTSTSATTTTSTTTSTGTTTTTTTGDLCGNGACDPGETAQSCPADCSSSCAHPLCEQGDPLRPGCDPCVDMVCERDPFCCENNWDDICIGEADGICGLGCCGDGQCNETCESCPEDCGDCPPGAPCAHSVCEVGVNGGEPLSTAECFDPCVQQVCAAMPSCCMGSPPAWDDACTRQAHMLCGADPCVTAVCQAMPECCTTGWTMACVNLAGMTCGASCDCAHSICDNGPPLVGTCDPCAQALCTVDPYCCENDWDQICVGEVETICGIDCT
jgi:hypothetical protein